jgi:ankyrin repeat protein
MFIGKIMFDIKTTCWAVASIFVSVIFVLSPFAQSNTLSAEGNYQQLVPYYYAAARTGDTEVIEAFIKAGFPINAKNAKGYTALMIATYHGRKGVVKELLVKGASVCEQDKRGNTALMAAIFRGELSIAKHLLSYKCDTESPNNAGQTAQDFAVVFGRTEIKALLDERGVEVL